MDWQKSLRTLFVATATIQLASLFVLYDAKGLQDRRAEALRTAADLTDIPFFGSPGESDIRNLPETIAAIIDSPNPTLPGRAELGRMLEVTFGSAPCNLSQWTDEVGDSTVSQWLREVARQWFLDVTGAYAGLSVYAVHDDLDIEAGSDALLPFVHMAGSHVLQPDGFGFEEVRDEYAEYRDGELVYSSDVPIALASGVLQDYLDLRTSVDTLALIDGFIDTPGALAFGPNAIVAARDPGLSPVTVFGVSLRVSGRGIVYLAIANSLIFLTYAWILRLSRPVTFAVQPGLEEGWFALSFPVWLRYVVLVGLPVLGIARVIWLVLDLTL